MFEIWAFRPDCRSGAASGRINHVQLFENAKRRFLHTHNKYWRLRHREFRGFNERMCFFCRCKSSCAEITTTRLALCNLWCVQIQTTSPESPLGLHQVSTLYLVPWHSPELDSDSGDIALILGFWSCQHHEGSRNDEQLNDFISSGKKMKVDTSPQLASYTSICNGGHVLTQLYSLEWKHKNHMYRRVRYESTSNRVHRHNSFPLPFQVMKIAKNFAYVKLATWVSSFISRSW